MSEGEQQMYPGTVAAVAEPDSVLLPGHDGRIDGE